MMNKRPYYLLVLAAILVLTMVFPSGALATVPTMVWCPGATAPGAAATCAGGTGDQTTFSNLISALTTKSGAGTIYVSTGYSDLLQTGDIIFDHSASALMNLTDLTITGWTFGSPGAAGTSTIQSHGIIIRGGPDWTGNVTLQGLNIPSAPSRAVDISATGTVTLTNITITNANGAGGAAAAIRATSINANIQGDNINVASTTSAAPSSTNYGGGAGLIANNGSITLTNSTFNNNTGYGIQLADKTTTTISGVTASGNGRNGLTAASDIVPHAPISITNSVFNNNGNIPVTNTAGNGKGIFTSAGSITLSNVTASGNKEEGLYASAPPNVSITLGTFNNNLKTGLTLVNNSTQTTLDQVTATGNGIMGADVETASASPVISNSTFNSNGALAGTPVQTSPNGAGLFIESKLGGTLKSVTAQSNIGAGLYLNSSNHTILGGSLPAVGGGFVISCGTIGGPSAGNTFYGIVYDLDDTFRSVPSDGRLELRNVTLANNSPSQTLTLSGTALAPTPTCGAAISGNAGIPGAMLTYEDSAPPHISQTAFADGNGNYVFIVPYNWGGTVTPSKAFCPTCDFIPDFLTYAGVQADQLSQNFGAESQIDVNIGGTPRGSYLVQPQGSLRVNYAGLDSGPVRVVSTNAVPIISAIREAWISNGVTTSFSQLMGLPLSQISDKYVFPGYNNVTLNDQLRIGNVDTVPSTVTVTIGGVLRGTYILQPDEAVRVNYAGLDSGPVIVDGTDGVDIISAIREAWAGNGTTTSFVQLMGLPATQLSDKYVFPAYNNVTLNEQLRIGNVDTVPSTVTVTIGGVLRGTYILQPDEALRVNYAGLDSGPVIVDGTDGVKIISAIRDAWATNGVTTSFSQLMGVSATQLSDQYVFPAYNNVTLNDQLRIGNVDTVPSTVTVTIGGVLLGTYTLQASQAVRVNYAGVDDGPVVVRGTLGVNIISAIREAWVVNGVTTSFVQLMGLPFGQLSDTYVFPGYNNVTLNDQLRIGVP